MCYCWSIWVKGRPEIASLSAFVAFILCLRRLISPLKSNAIFSCACCGIFYYGDQIFEDFFRHRLGGEEVKVCSLFMRISFVFTFSIWFFRPAFHHWFIITDHGYLLNHTSWRLFREAPKQWHFKLICHVNLVVRWFSFTNQVFQMILQFYCWQIFFQNFGCFALFGW